MKVRPSLALFILATANLLLSIVILGYWLYPLYGQYEQQLVNPLRPILESQHFALHFLLVNYFALGLLIWIAFFLKLRARG